MLFTGKKLKGQKSNEGQLIFKPFFTFLITCRYFKFKSELDWIFVQNLFQTSPIVKPMKKNSLLIFLLFISGILTAQQWQNHQGGGNRDRSAMNIGRFYGKIVDENGKGVGYAALQLFGMRFDTTTKSMKEVLISGQITEENGDFSLEKIPVVGEFTLKISILGYSTVEQKVTFGLTPEKMRQNRQAGGQRRGFPGEAGDFDKDLGNIVIQPDTKTLDEVVVTGEATNVTLALDKKVFRVDKDATATGGTAEDALRNVPSLSVDIDGNLTVRNASPQLFVDGRPTNLSLDQIAADEIESVEVITNPSAKYDASGGQGGIVNIVLKKDRRFGYNGSVRTGVDSRAGFNFGGNLNIREGKVNGFLNAGYFRRVSVSEGETDRQNLFSNPQTNVLQITDSDFKGYFSSLRGGIDWFVDNRNTLTFAGNYRRGQFQPDTELNILTDTLLGGTVSSSEALRISQTERGFESLGASFLYKRIFPKKGKELTADVNFNGFNFDGNGIFENRFLSNGFTTNERQVTNSESQFVTIQSDYVEPFGETIKVEAGIRAQVRDYTSFNFNFFTNPETNEEIRVPNFADEYEFNDQVYAAYTTFSQNFENWGYQLGLRAESSQYTGILPETQTTFENDFPISLFPSIFLTKNLNEQDNIQASYTRRINRPSFFNLIPFTDFSDSLNLRRGNPNLLPEFTNSFEVNYQNIFKGGDNLLVTLYYKTATNLITTYQFAEFNTALGRDVIISTYENSNSSSAYGAEITMRNSIGKSLEFTSNVNLYNSRVDASNVDADLINEQFSWIFKENINIRLPKIMTIQLSGQYVSRQAFSPSSGGRFQGWRGTSNTAQGYTKAIWFVDIALRKDILKRKGSVTLSLRDIFRSRRSGSFAESEFFIQDSWRLRNPQLVRLNFSYRFGSPDISLFKRKNNNINNDGAELMN